METVKEKLDYIIKEINETPKEGVYKAYECIRNRKKFYRLNIARLNEIPAEKLKKHSFVSEVLYLSEKLEKESYFKRLKNKVQGLEVHKYAPELNCLHLKNGVILKTPQQTDISLAVMFWIETNSLIKTKNTILKN